MRLAYHSGVARRPGQTRAPARSRARRVRDTVRVPVAMAAETRSAAWLRNFRLSGFALAVLLLIVAALVVLAPGLKTWVEQRQQISRLQSQVDDAKRSVGVLKRETARWDDPAYVEAQARSRLYYVYPGEVSYLVTGVQTTPTAATKQPVSATIQDTRYDWVQSLLSSVYVAGTTTGTPAQLQQGG